ncbi:MAG TPA: nickel-type superoxide dismutase maturation protease [Pseudonocardiaceae bacterium]|nr:nickel-type superoxide dismutase maturation protease [Pseudonocardiaceae bacterium]
MAVFSPVGWPWRRAVVRGPSMSPTLSDGDVVLASLRARPRPGAVVLVRWAQRPGQLSVKRVVGRHGNGWWVLGDNPDGSTDSRQLGPADPIAVVIARLWPAPRPLPRRSSSWQPPPSAGSAG